MTQLPKQEDRAVTRQPVELPQKKTSIDLINLTSESSFSTNVQLAFNQELKKEYFTGLKLESTLQELFLYDCQIELTCLGKELAAVFDNNPLLPGAILTEQGKFVGKISRQRFFKIISRPYGRDLFFNSPLSRLLICLKNEALVFNSDMPIVKAASRCLQRPPELLAEPLVIKCAQEVYKILDVHQLLIAQAQIHKLATQLIQKQADQLVLSKKALDDELEKGRQIQRDFLPSEIPQLPNLEIATCFYPARQVAGDFYDVFQISGDSVGLVIADVCDKGVGAALFMALFRSLIRIFSGQTRLYGLSIADQDQGIHKPTDTCSSLDLKPLQAIELTNNYIIQNHAQMSMFATLFFGILNPVTNFLTYINAGHEPLFIINSTGIKETLKPTSPAVGMMPEIKFNIKQVQLEPGDILLSYTDGVTEARSPSGEFFTLKRLLSLLEQPSSSAHDLLERIKTNLFAHINNAPPFDDITMLAVRLQQG